MADWFEKSLEAQADRFLDFYKIDPAGQTIGRSAEEVYGQKSFEDSTIALPDEDLDTLSRDAKGRVYLPQKKTDSVRLKAQLSEQPRCQ